MKAAKKCFSPLFHVNQNPIYSQLDIHSDYIDEQMKSKASQIEKYNFAKNLFVQDLIDKTYSFL